MRLPTPVRIGVESVKANAVPMAILWALAGVLVFGYYFVSWVPGTLEPLASWQCQCGWTASFLNRFIFCGVIPGVFMLAMGSLAVRFPLSAVCVQTIWSGICGVVSGWMFTLHAYWVGTGIDFLTLATKAALQQFVWTPFFFIPVGALIYYWIGHDFAFKSFRAVMTVGFWRKNVLSNLCANWIIWFPCAFLIHMFPTPLQIQLTGFLNSLTCVVMLFIGKND